MIGFKVPNTGNKYEDIKAVVDRFWDGKEDATEASHNELITFVIAVTTIVDREDK